MILIFFFFVQKKTPLPYTVYPWVFFRMSQKGGGMCIFFSLCQSIFLRFKMFLIANNTVNHRKITRYTVFINMIMMVRYMQMFYLVGTKYHRKFDMLMSSTPLEILSLRLFTVLQRSFTSIQQHNNTCIFDVNRCFVLFGKRTTLFGDLTIQSRLHPNMIHEICHVNNGLNLIKAYECQQIYVTNVG